MKRFQIFVQVAIASGDIRYMEKIREAQMGINLPNVVCVDAKGLELKEDHLHLTTGAQVKLGHILGEAYFKHFAGSAQSSKCCMCFCYLSRLFSSN